MLISDLRQINRSIFYWKKGGFACGVRFDQATRFEKFVQIERNKCERRPTTVQYWSFDTARRKIKSFTTRVRSSSFISGAEVAPKVFQRQEEQF